MYDWEWGSCCMEGEEDKRELGGLTEYVLRCGVKVYNISRLGQCWVHYYNKNKK